MRLMVRCLLFKPLKAISNSDDAAAKTQSVVTTYTVLLSLTKYHQHWRVDQLKIGEVQPSENTKNTKNTVY